MQPALNAEFALALLPSKSAALVDQIAGEAERDIAAMFEHVRRSLGQKFRRTRERLERQHGQ